jgi:hypothetical protein
MSGRAFRLLSPYSCTPFWVEAGNHRFPSECGALPREEKEMHISRTLALAFVTAVLLGAVALTQERKIKRSDLPAAVEKTVTGQSQGATILGYSEERENGKTYYEAELMVNGHSKDLLIEGNGTIAEVEEQIAFDRLPAAVRDGLLAKAGKGKLLKVESITKHDKLVAYEAKVLTGAKKSEVQVDPDGRPLDHEE